MSLNNHGFVVIGLPELSNGVYASFDDLPADPYSGNSRSRRFSQFRLDYSGSWKISLLPHRPFIQARSFNRLVGGIRRDFSPLVVDPSPVLAAFAEAIGLDEESAWQSNVHQVRVQAFPGIDGQVVPEGRHQDGHDYACLAVVQRTNIDGGTTTLTTEQGAILFESKIKPGQGIAFDDRKLWHDTTPVVASHGVGARDMFIVVFNHWSRRKYGPEHEASAAGG